MKLTRRNFLIVSAITSIIAKLGFKSSLLYQAKKKDEYKTELKSKFSCDGLGIYMHPSGLFAQYDGDHRHLFFQFTDASGVEHKSREVPFIAFSDPMTTELIMPKLLNERQALINRYGFSHNG